MFVIVIVSLNSNADYGKYYAANVITLSKHVEMHFDINNVMELALPVQNCKFQFVLNI